MLRSQWVRPELFTNSLSWCTYVESYTPDFYTSKLTPCCPQLIKQSTICYYVPIKPYWVLMVLIIGTEIMTSYATVVFVVNAAVKASPSQKEIKTTPQAEIPLNSTTTHTRALMRLYYNN